MVPYVLSLLPVSHGTHHKPQNTLKVFWQALDSSRASGDSKNDKILQEKEGERNYIN